MNHTIPSSHILILCPAVWTQLPPLGIAALSAYLHQQSISHTCLDLNILLFQQALPHDQKLWDQPAHTAFHGSLHTLLNTQQTYIINALLNAIAHETIQTLCFSVFKSNLPFSLWLAQQAKQKNPQIKIIFGGPECWAILQRQQQLTPVEQAGLSCIDALIIGEGEHILSSLLTSTTWPQPDKTLSLPTHSIPLYTYHEQQCLDAYPSPRFTDLPLPLYRKKHVLPITASRGCIYRCHFCAEKYLYRAFRSRSPLHVIQEMEHHQQTYGISTCIFYDSLFNGSLSFLHTFCDMLIEKGSPFTWEAQMAIRKEMDQTLIEKMKKAGCYNLFIGLESGSSRILEKMHKPFQIPDASRFFAKLSRAGLHFEISLIVGFPGETEDDYTCTEQFIVDHARLIPKIAQINPYIPISGTASARDAGARLPQAVTSDRIKRLIRAIETLNIRYTKAYINNLVAAGFSGV